MLIDKHTSYSFGIYLEILFIYPKALSRKTLKSNNGQDTKNFIQTFFLPLWQIDIQLDRHFLETKFFEVLDMTRKHIQNSIEQLQLRTNGQMLKV